MTLSIKLILLLCLMGFFPPCQTTVDMLNGSDGLRATYISYGYAQPLAIFRNGELVVRYGELSARAGNGTYWGLGIERLEREEPERLWIKQLRKETFYQYTLPPNIQRTPAFADFDGVYQLYAGDSDEPWRVITNVSTPDFMADVRYAHYTIDEQDQVPAVYHEYVRKKADTDGLINVPIIIEELWEYDFDHDGKMEAFISANNFLPWSEDNDAYNENHRYKADDPRQMAEGGVGCYAYYLFYSETYMPMTLGSSGALLLHDRFYTTSDEPSPYTQPIYVYDQHGQVGLYELWKTEEEASGEFYPPFGYDFQPVICDLDGNGLYDFFVIDEAAFDEVKVYLQNADGEFNFIGGIVFA